MGRGGVAGRSSGAAADQPRCEGTTKHGAPCQAFALLGRARCIAHDPERSADVRAARARGGAAASKLRALQGRRAKLETPAQLLRFAATVIHDTIEHRLDPDTARVALYGLNICRELVKASDQEARLFAVEAALAAGRGRTWRR